MKKTILITGATDGIGRATAEKLASQGHQLLIHGRSEAKLRATQEALAASCGSTVESYRADLSKLDEVQAMAEDLLARSGSLDVVIHNAGVFNTPTPVTADGLDIRFVVNAIAPYLLTQRLLPRLSPAGRVINLSSAAQAPVDLRALAGEVRLGDMAAYSQSKLALTMWSRYLAQQLGPQGPVILAVNPGSLLATKMVKEAFGTSRGTVDQGADILCRAALDDEFATASGKYFDNDSGRFAAPHPDGLNAAKCEQVVRSIEAVLARLVSKS
ncbi:MAG: SDR family NAD(P)-dependent oxidoreductase [Acidobacteriota bacterium]